MSQGVLRVVLSLGSMTSVFIPKARSMPAQQAILRRSLSRPSHGLSIVLQDGAMGHRPAFFRCSFGFFLQIFKGSACYRLLQCRHTTREYTRQKDCRRASNWIQKPASCPFGWCISFQYACDSSNHCNGAVTKMKASMHNSLLLLLALSQKKRGEYTS